jgi:uncharacterized membrane protein
VLAEEYPRLGSDLERLRRQALRRELEDAAAVRVEPQLRDHLAREVARLPLQLEHEDRPEHREIFQIDPVRSVSPVQGTLLLGVKLAQPALTEHHLVDGVRVSLAFQPPRAHESTRYRVDLDAEPGETPHVGADLIGVERPQLDHRIAHTPLNPARAHDDARPVERQVGRVEERKEADGKVRVTKTEKPTQHGAWTGAGVGAVVGLIFPPALIGSAIVGAGAGGLVGHLSKGISRGDLKDLGEELDAGTAAVIVLGESKIEEQLEKALKRANKLIEKQVDADAEELKRQIDAAAKEGVA